MCNGMCKGISTSKVPGIVPKNKALLASEPVIGYYEQNKKNWYIEGYICKVRLIQGYSAGMSLEEAYGG